MEAFFARLRRSSRKYQPAFLRVSQNEAKRRDGGGSGGSDEKCRIARFTFSQEYDLKSDISKTQKSDQTKYGNNCS